MKTQIIQEIDDLAKKYNQLFARDEDIKSLQGVERCIEMKMKACGIDGKNNPETNTNDNNQPTILLSELPTDILKQIFNIINPNTMQQQQL